MSETYRDTEANDIELRAKMARALAKGGMDGVHVVDHESANRLLTPRRRQILRTLKHDQPASVRDLARKLDRDKAAVSRDLAVLATESLITYESDGRAKRPVLVQDHVVVEPII